MTAAAFADLVQARPIGRGRWQARCPAHRDKSPSLSIAEGRKQPVILICRSHGCSPTAIVSAIGLTLRDLSKTTPATPAALAEAKKQRETREAEECHSRSVGRRLVNSYRRLACAVDSLGSRLAWDDPMTLQGDMLAAVFHFAVNMLNRADSAQGACGLVKVPLAKVYMAWPPFPDVPTERTEADRVTTKVQLLHFLATGHAEPQGATERTTQKLRANGASERVYASI